MDRRAFVAMALAACLVTGCRSSKMPDLHPVKGTIVHGSTPIKNAIVRLVNEDKEQGAQFTVVGTTDDQGQVSLETIELRTNLKKSGVPEGQYMISIDLPIDDNQKGGGVYKMPKPFTVRATDNTLGVIDVSRKF